MTWSRFDDGYDEHDKVEYAWDADRATIGLHVMATTACNRWLSDGVIKPRWLIAKLPERKERERVLSALVEHGLFDVLPAGQEREVVDGDGQAVTIGPFTEDRYVVHDFLDRHDSSTKTKARREADAKRKKERRRPDSKKSPAAVRAESARNPRGLQRDGAPESDGSPLTGGSASAPPHPDPTRPDQEAPLPPEGELPELPVKPTGNRKTELARFDTQTQVYAAARFPDIAEPEGSQFVRAAIGQGCADHAAVARYVRQWAPAPGDVVPIRPEEEAA